MKKNKLIRLSRKWHRYLGLLLGIQFFIWTLGGLYFSWTKIDVIRGDHLKNDNPILPHGQNYISPAAFLGEILTDDDALVSLNLVTILNKPYYELTYTANGLDAIRLVDAMTGITKKPLNQKEAILVAHQKLNVKAEVEDVTLVEEIGNHHEYRGRPLPAYAITFDSPANTTVYVSKEYGNVQTFRNNQWRLFDFLWMMHTMDYEGRDDLNNWLLRIFSIFGLVTILSGFTLYYLTSKYSFRTKKAHTK